jgi:hypothetical protein
MVCRTGQVTLTKVTCPVLVIIFSHWRTMILTLIGVLKALLIIYICETTGDDEWRKEKEFRKRYTWSDWSD